MGSDFYCLLFKSPFIMKMCVALSVSGIFASTCSQPSPYACTGSPMSFSLCQLFVLSTSCCFVSWSPVSVCPLDTPWIFMSKYLTTHLQLLFCVCIICYMYLPQHLPLWYLTFGAFNNTSELADTARSKPLQGFRLFDVQSLLSVHFSM